MHVHKKSRTLLCTAALCALQLLFTTGARAQGQLPGPAPQSHSQTRGLPTREDIQRWIETNLDTPPLFREGDVLVQADLDKQGRGIQRSEEHTSELQSLIT